MEKKYILGIDQSTQGTKGVILDEDGNIIARYSLQHRQIINEYGWVSHDLNEIAENVLEVCRKVIEKADIHNGRIVSMGIANQRETAAAWNKITGSPLAEAVVWQCSRASDLCEQIEEKYHCSEMIYERTGLKISPYYPAAKYAWLLQNVQAVREAAAKEQLAFGTIDSYIVNILTGGKSYKTDYSNASRTQLFHIRELKWDSEICKIFGISEENLPEVIDSDGIYGETDLGGYLDYKIPIRGVMGDSHGALFGHNCRKRGSIKVTYGTGSSVMLNMGEHCIRSKNGLSTSLAWKVNGSVQYVLEGNINYTGAVITWLQDSLHLITNAVETEELALNANPKDTSCLIPAFTGLSAPWWNNNAKARIVGMTRFTGRNEIVRAACDSIAYQITDILNAMKKDTGFEISEICVDGAPTKNRYLMQFQADIGNVSVKRPDREELSVIGVSYLAGIACGLYDEEKIYENISYQHYRQSMPEKEREERISRWESAVNNLNGEE